MVRLKRLLWLVAMAAPAALLVAFLSLPPGIETQLERHGFTAAAGRYDVEILRDQWGVPHIYGSTDPDVAFGLAYAHAEDDFATIQDVILATRGTLAAEKGMAAARTDYLAQWMGIWPAIERGYATLPAQTRAVAEAYAAGLNLYAARNPERVSRYLLPVTGQDLVAGFTFKTPMFYGFDETLGMLLDPDAPHEVARTGEASLTWQPQQRLPVGSQGIAVAPHRSADGATRLLVNSHQPLTGPVAWYEARLHSGEGWNMAGATFPGAPVIIHGHNANIGWSNTVNKPDLVDIYRLTINPDNPAEYRLDGEWRKYRERTAKITVRLWGPFHWTVQRPIKIAEHGPVLETEHGVYAVRWAGMGEIRTLDFMLALNRAKDREEFEAALQMQAMPSINYIYADKAGNIAHYYNAMFPERIGGWDWQKILPGDRSELIWQRYRDFSAVPRTVNPVSGLVYNANNAPFQATDGDDDAWAEDYPDSMGIETRVTNRALQIEALYGAEQKISAEEFERLKFDHRYHPDSYQVKALRRWLASEKPADLLREPYHSALAALARWDLSTSRDNRQAALAVLTLQPVQDAGNEAVSDTVIGLAFRRAVDQLVEHHGNVEVPYGAVNRHVRGGQGWPLNGGPDTLRAVYGGPLNGAGELENRAGDGYIMVVAWDDEGRVRSRAVHNFGSATLDHTSPHYADQAPLFAAEKLRPVHFERAALESHVTRRYRPGQE
ncbi:MULTISPECIES: penicillin acylase family protein [unclassified Microbulbifer]|uniref:penicillin acylase family protein n=1 Tax=unclassified Microbulbifer TaxID=2619833 RepID=UPI001E60CB4F|nr:acylase [Microbulbifer sp. YPW16]UHQ54522.1 acylase [Microbulbifer sp. YPW16]